MSRPDEWVAVAPEYSSETQSPAIRKPQSAFQIFQKQEGSRIQEELAGVLGGKFDIGQFGRACRRVWQEELTEEQRQHYNELARQDRDRYARESHLADVQAIQQREERRRQKEEEEKQLLLESASSRTRTTRRGRQQLQERANKKDDDSDYESGGEDNWDEDEEDEDGDGEPSAKRPKKVPKKPTRQLTAASARQLEHRAKVQQEKADKESYVAARQLDLRKEKATQAKRRLEFLLQQSNIFSHFGRVKEDSAKYGIKQNTVGGAKDSGNDGENPDDADEDEEAAEQLDATYLTSQPSTLGHGTMRAYQLEGLNWMIRLQENGVNGILADEMGLGKTLQSLSVLVYMKEFRNVSGPHLILVPKSTLSNWINEIGRWAPGLRAVKFHGDKATREAIARDVLEPAQRDENRDWNVVVTTYEVCNIEKNVLNKFAWSYLIIDEAHRLKNEASSFSKTVRLFETRYRLLITGTPLQNSLHELWALLNFLVPDVFESSDQFDEWFNLDIEDNDEKNKLISQLHKILRPFMLRRLKADVETTLPPKHETILFTGMSAMQKKLYRDILLRDFNAIQGDSGSRTAILNIVMQLRKCAGHPYLFPGVEDRTLPPLGEHLVENCGKMVLLDKLLKRLKERDHRVLLFTQMTRVLDILEDYLVMRRYAYCRIDGNTSYEDRESFIDAYNAPNSSKFLFLLSTRAGGLGLNLQTADVVILYDSDWNPQADLQAQDRAHRIGQRKPVQVFRFVTEHTIEEKIVERAQQKLKLDAMVVQQGRLKSKDSKLSRDELLAAVRFGADKIFKSKDSSITDDDIDLILNQGKQKTQEMNEKLKKAEKGDLLDFKFDGSSVQTFEGVDYSTSALAQAKQQQMLGLFDIGKRERKEANYNENSLYQRQIATLQGPKKPKKKKEIKLPKHLRLPRLEEWQMFDKEALNKIQEEEEEAFRALAEDVQKAATMKRDEQVEAQPVVMPPLLTEERAAEKKRLLGEGFTEWNRVHYMAFWRASARYGRKSYDKIALEVGKTEEEVNTFASAFWGETGKTRIAKHEYERAVKFIERGEKKIFDTRNLERGLRVFVSLFDNPWEEIEFINVNCKDKMFTMEEDRHLLCWVRKYGYGQWRAIQFAIRRNPNFRFDYFFRSCPIELLQKRCEQLMKAAEKEVEHYERQTREIAGLPTEPKDGEPLPPIVLPKFTVLKNQMRMAKRLKSQHERKKLEDKVTEVEEQIQALQRRLKEITSGTFVEETTEPSGDAMHGKDEEEAIPTEKEIEDAVEERGDGAMGGDGVFCPFPHYDGNQAPIEWKKPFTQFCNKKRKEVKNSLDASERKDKAKVNGILKDRWAQLSEREKQVFRLWSEWDKKRFDHETSIFQRSNDTAEDHDDGNNETGDDNTRQLHVPKKKRPVMSDDSIPRKRRK